MKFWDIVWLLIITFSIGAACLYSDIKWSIVLVFVIGGYFIYALRKSVLHLLDEIEKLKSERK